MCSIANSTLRPLLVYLHVRSTGIRQCLCLHAPSSFCSDEDLNKLHSYSVLSALTTAIVSNPSPVTDYSINLSAVADDSVNPSAVTDDSVELDAVDMNTIDADYLKVDVTGDAGVADTVPMGRRGSDVYLARRESNLSLDAIAAFQSSLGSPLPSAGVVGEDLIFPARTQDSTAAEQEEADEEEAVLDFLDSMRESFEDGNDGTADEIVPNRRSNVDIRTAEMESQQAAALVALAVSSLGGVLRYDVSPTTAVLLFLGLGRVCACRFRSYFWFFGVVVGLLCIDEPLHSVARVLAHAPTTHPPLSQPAAAPIVKLFMPTSHGATVQLRVEIEQPSCATQSGNRATHWCA